MDLDYVFLTAMPLTWSLVDDSWPIRWYCCWSTQYSTEALRCAAVGTGAEGGEVIIWLVMRGVMAPQVREGYQCCYAPMTTGIDLLALQDDVVPEGANAPTV
jgi:hypothetical protein